jgi:hypothetical protein
MRCAVVSDSGVRKALAGSSLYAEIQSSGVPSGGPIVSAAKRQSKLESSGA